jgi:DNA repair protein RecN (Recombination protein N)
MKVDLVADALSHLGGLRAAEVVAGPVLPAWGYRTSLRAAVDDSGHAGLRAARSHRVVVPGHCGVAHPLVDEVLTAGRFPGAREVLIRVGVASGDRLVLVDPVEGEHADEVVAQATVPADAVVVGPGDGGTTRERVAGRWWQVSPRSFFQARPDGATCLANEVVAAVADVGASGNGRLLDAFAGPDHELLLDAYRESYRAWSAYQRRRRLLEEDATTRARRLDQLAAERDEIDRAGLDIERDGSIDQEIERLANADALRESVDLAHAAAGPSGALEALGRAVAALRRTPVADATLGTLGERLAAVSRELSEVVADLAAFASDVEADDSRLDRLQSRKRELTTLMRRFGASIESVLEHRSVVVAELEDIAALEADAENIEADLQQAADTLQEVGRRLSASRGAAGEQLCGEVDAHLKELGLEHAHLHVRLVEESSPGPEGLDRVELLLAANPGEPPARLADGASGGERSRVALALEVVLAAGDDRGVLVFDEVDAGIGGSTALAVGAKLARLSRDAEVPRQVLCVTHLAQVAAYADHHHVVEKSVRDGRTATSVRRVSDDARIEELSRMLGGEATADAGLAHAKGLLESAQHHGEQMVQRAR